MVIKQLKMKDIDVYSMALSGLIYIALGILFLTQKGTLLLAAKGLLNLLVILFAVTAVFQLIGFTPRKPKRLTAISGLLGFATNIAMAMIIYFKPGLVAAIFPVFFGVYAFCSGIIRLLIYMQYKKNAVSRRFFIAIGGIILMLLGLMIVINPLAAILPISNVVGLFFILYGISFLIDALLEGVPQEAKQSFKRRVRISLPIFVVAFIPHKILMKINKALETEALTEEDLNLSKENTDFDLEVLIHVAEKGISAFGHVDIWFDGKVMTYGSYDKSTYKLGGIISDGVLIEMSDKNQYIDFSQEHMGKTLFGFGLKLTKEQKQRVRDQITQIQNNLYVWHPKSEKASIAGITPEKPYKDYASMVYDNLNSKFYKFNKGPFKTYFSLHTNCVLLADSIVGQAGIDVVAIQGLISPGAYFEFFNREFRRKNSFVISRTIYHKVKD